MSDDGDADHALYIGCAADLGATQRLLYSDGVESEVRIEANVPPDAAVLVVTRRRPHSTVLDQRVSAAAAGISASRPARDHAAARREVERTSEAVWATATIVINDELQPVAVLQLLSGSWAGYVQYKGMGIVLGSINIDLRDPRLATVAPADLAD